MSALGLDAVMVNGWFVKYVSTVGAAMVALSHAFTVMDAVDDVGKLKPTGDTIDIVTAMVEASVVMAGAVIVTVAEVS